MRQIYSPACPTCPHRTGPLLRCCGAEELEMLAEQKSVQHYQKGQSIYQQDTKVTGIHCVHEGKIKITRASDDNKEHIMQLVRPGELIGWRALLAGGVHSSSAIALDDCTVCFLPKVEFVSLIQANKQFSNNLLHLMANIISTAENKLLELAYKPVRERLAGALVLLQQTYGTLEATEPFSIALAREDVAALVGTAKETVSRLLSEFKEEGLITTQGSRITLLKVQQLTQIATRYSF
jgi:CRP-like cAMP-binding protein